MTASVVRIQLPRLRREHATAPPARPAEVVGAVAGRRDRARFGVLFGAVLFLAWNVGLLAAMDHGPAVLRDPEYGRRLNRVTARHAERPDAKLLVALGSSRVAMGLRPEFFNEPTGPVAVNFAQVGGGPTLTAMTVRRLFAAGVVPDAVLLEYWPPFLRGDGQYMEQHRIDPHRLMPGDREFMLEHFETPQHYLDIVDDIRQFPVTGYRRQMMSQICPGWLPYNKRLDAAWQKMDRWGWLPGIEDDPKDWERTIRHREAMKYYDPLFAAYRVTPNQDKAMREVIGTLQARSVKVVLLWMPESSEFRQTYPAAVLREGEAYLAKLRADYGLPLIDARQWGDDISVADGFHLTQPGAAKVSQKLGPELKAVFPTLWGSP